MATTGEVRGAISTPGPCVVRLTWSTLDGTVVARHRSYDRRYTITRAPGTYVVDAEDDRPLTDPRRHAGTRALVEVTAGSVTDLTLHLVRDAALRGRVEVAGEPARHAQVHVVHEDGACLSARADAEGRFVVAGLRPGAVTVIAHDARRRWSGPPVRLDDGTADPTDRTDLVLRLDTPTTGLVVTVGLADGAPLAPTYATFVNLDTAQRHRVPVRDGLCAVTGVAPGLYDLEVEPALGSLGGRRSLGVARTGELASGQIVLSPGATLEGRVVDLRSGQGDLAAVVTLVAADGTELERTRTSRDGHFLLGHGLATADELTVVVTGGPERRHVTRVAVADVTVTAGARCHLGDLALEPTCRARWTTARPDNAMMRLPATRV